eukprot:1451842-Pyramimonas_sp.AAC.1
MGPNPRAIPWYRHTDAPIISTHVPLPSPYLYYPHIAPKRLRCCIIHPWPLSACVPIISTHGASASARPRYPLQDEAELQRRVEKLLSLIHISEPTRPEPI